MSEPDAGANAHPIIKAVDRTRSSATGDAEVKPDRFPRTSRRKLRIDGVLRRRQPTLAVVLEDVHDPHNASAVLRSCDAVGVLDVHLVYAHDPAPIRAFDRTTSASAAKWIRTHVHESIESCFGLLRSQGFSIQAAALRDDSVDMYALDLAAPAALVFGNEQRGVTDEAVSLADGTFTIPMLGMVESLNISVACAVSLYEAMRQRRASGMYDQPQLNAAELRALGTEWFSR